MLTENLYGNFVRGHVQTVPGYMQVKSEAHSFNRAWRNVGWVHTDRHAHTKVRILYLPVLFHSLGGYNNIKINTIVTATLKS